MPSSQSYAYGQSQSWDPAVFELMKEAVPPSPCVAERPTPTTFSFANKLLEQENSFMNRTFTLDTNKKERQAEFSIDDAIRGFRSRSSDPRRRSCKAREDANKRACSHPMFASVCKLPSLTCKKEKTETRLISTRPWSRTQEELRKYKEALE
uniref:TPX2_importin domain-containing protein n=1 Tax=Haemonchus contortus TaxID=6289 RepID=A0A7I4YVB8_HAECO